MAEKKDIPNVAALQAAILQGLAKLGGEASNEELSAEVGRTLGLNSDLLAVKHDPARGNRTEFEYRMAWARTKLKDAGSLSKVSAKRWALSSHD